MKCSILNTKYHQNYLETTVVEMCTNTVGLAFDFVLSEPDF